jgi:hypothetical protein
MFKLGRSRAVASALNASKVHSILLPASNLFKQKLGYCMMRLDMDMQIYGNCR